MWLGAVHIFAAKNGSDITHNVIIAEHYTAKYFPQHLKSEWIGELLNKTYVFNLNISCFPAEIARELTRISSTLTTLHARGCCNIMDVLIYFISAKQTYKKPTSECLQLIRQMFVGNKSSRKIDLTLVVLMD